LPCVTELHRVYSVRVVQVLVLAEGVRFFFIGGNDIDKLLLCW
jgi:hypothetical protein